MLLDVDADTLIMGWGGTYGHIYTAAEELNAAGRRVAFTQFRYINPLPANTRRNPRPLHKTVIVAGLNTGMFADICNPNSTTSVSVVSSKIKASRSRYGKSLTV